MMAMLWAQQIMLGKKTYSQVPRLLKDKVKEVLIDSGAEDLVLMLKLKEQLLLLHHTFLHRHAECLLPNVGHGS